MTELIKASFFPLLSRQTLISMFQEGCKLYMETFLFLSTAEANSQLLGHFASVFEAKHQTKCSLFAVVHN